jgi:hypothetical protein
MRILDKKDTTNWLEYHKLMNSNNRLIVSEFLDPITFKIPVDAGKKYNLGKLIASFYNTDEEGLLWINEYGIWPSCEDWNLFNGFRRSLGENSPLYDKPGHLFSINDMEVIVSLLALTLYFFWGAIIVSENKNLLVKISHDELIYFYAKDTETISNINKAMAKLYISVN